MIIPTKYTDFANVFLKKLAKMLPKQTVINKHNIKLVKNKQFFYRSIYNLSLIKLKTVKTDFKINLTNGFIWPLKSFASAFIFLSPSPIVACI